ncbi:MAG TPA: glutamate-1-semialdehyde 2,1-aminomutase [Polyangia bacterium]|jgi:glutamate-1-semialdehyde 2,1-aminomutase|nr:glutamate-1-semialdehyde 2,1-aminomutase [Polyangia bacterium]HVZ74556.1 glutamate-1-semialdehyde 2,1-aminomutase [Polyangia bacterium]
MATNPGPKRPRSTALFERAQRIFPGGVNSPVRAFKAVGGSPVFIQRGIGPYVYDVDGNRYTDFVGSWGPLILGHADPDVVAAIVHTAASGTSFGAPTQREIEFGEMVQFMMPSMEKLRLVSSGTEATMSALRAARGFTKRDKIVKIDGGYHGHADALLAAAGSGAVTLGIPGSAGVPKGAVADTIVVPFNDLDAIRAAFDENKGQIAAVILEPIPANMGVVLPRPAYLPVLRSICDEQGTMLIFDEVITGFRVARGGAQQLFGVRPDLTCLGKIAGGGMPLGIYGGRADVMDVVAPLGPVYQAGTLSGNPVAVAAGLATLKRLDERAFVALEGLGRALEDELSRAIRRTNTKARVQRVGSAFTLFFTTEEVVDLTSAKKADTTLYAKFFHGMLERGFMLPPAQFEAGFVSLAHTLDDVQGFVTAAKEVLTKLKDAPAAL